MNTLTDLKVFYYVAKYKSYTKASNFCHITKPAISQHIKNLEEIYNTTLLIRHKNNSISLTDSGQKLFPLAKDVLVAEKKCTEAMEENQSDELTGTVRIGTGSFMVPYIRVAGIRMRREYPKVRLIVEKDRTETLNRKLQDQDIDLAFTINMAEEDEGIVSRPFVPVRLACIMKKTHPLAKKNEVSFEDLKKYEVALTDANQRVFNSIHKYAPNVDPNELNILCILNETYEVLRAVIDLNMITFLPSIFANELEGLVAKPIKELPDFVNSNLHYLADVPQSRALRKFIEMLEEEAKHI